MCGAVPFAGECTTSGNILSLQTKGHVVAPRPLKIQALQIVNTVIRVKEKLAIVTDVSTASGQTSSFSLNIRP